MRPKDMRDTEILKNFHAFIYAFLFSSILSFTKLFPPKRLLNFGTKLWLQRDMLRGFENGVDVSVRDIVWCERRKSELKTFSTLSFMLRKSKHRMIFKERYDDSFIYEKESKIWFFLWCSGWWYDTSCIEFDHKIFVVMLFLPIHKATTHFDDSKLINFPFSRTLKECIKKYLRKIFQVCCWFIEFWLHFLLFYGDL